MAKLSFSQDAEKRAAVVKKILNVKGPFSPYADSLRKTIDNVMKYAELRNLSAHGMMYRPGPEDTSLSSSCAFACIACSKARSLTKFAAILP